MWILDREAGSEAPRGIHRAIAVVARHRAAFLLCLAACGGEATTPLAVTVRVVDEAGAPIAGAAIELAPRGDGDRGEAEIAEGGGPAGFAGRAGGGAPRGINRLTTDVAGTARIGLDRGPAYALVSATGHLREPVPLGWDDAGQVVTVRLLGDGGGRRVVIHSAGDVMFGRRYEAPPQGAPLVPQSAAGTGAADVVASIAPLFTAADVRTINLETVVTDLPDEAAYPGKRFILRTRPSALTGVKALAPDVVVLANNHQRDFLDRGVADTLSALDEAGFNAIGASTGDGPPRDTAVVDVRGTKVAVLAWTTVDGTFVNDSYPIDGTPIPPDVTDPERWQYDPRTWGFSAGGLDVPAAARRIGSAWTLFAAGEPGLAGAELAAAWSSLAGVYPELQDWVYRRGHGGAAFWSKDAAARIAAARQEADVVIVQIHGGFQFQEASSANVRAIARRAIDAGADLVVGHHPHVLQGLEWYRGKLIAYSLGNFVFDQDFLSTFPSAVLRTVWEGRTLVEARLVPVELDAYRPTVAVDRGARRTLLTLWERSVLRAAADRNGGAVVPLAAEPDADTALPGFALEHHTARVLPALPAAAELRLDVPAGGVAAIPDRVLVDPRLGGAADVSVGRDILGWGDLDDRLADDEARGDAHWSDLDHLYKEALLDSSGRGHLRLRRLSTSDAAVLARPVARVPLPRHRLFSAPGTALDPAASYSLRLRARASKNATAHARVDLYAFDDTNPTEDPDSTLVAKVDLPFTPGADWQTFDLAIAPEQLGAANMALIYLALDPPPSKQSSLEVDDVELIEWRPAASMPDRLGRYDLVRNDGSAPATITVRTYGM